MSGLYKDKLIFDTAATLSENDNVGAYLRTSGGLLLTSTTVGGDEALDVNIVQSTGQYAEDSVHGSGDIGNFILAVRNDAGTALAANGDYIPLSTDANGNLRVNASVTVNAEKAEDSAHLTGDTGNFVLAVRQDSIASSVDTDGDYAAFKIDAIGALYADIVGSNIADDAADAHNPVKIGTRAVNGPLAAVSAGDDRANAISDRHRRIYINDSPNINVACATVTVDTTVGGVNLSASPLTGRRRMIVQNRGNQEIFLGPSGVTTANGLGVAARGSAAFEIGEDVDIYGIRAAGSSDVRVFQLA